MNKRVAYYMPKGTHASWPAGLVERFRGNVSRHGIVYFDEGAQAERDFQAAVSALGLSATRYTLWDVSGKDLYLHSFHYLTVVGDSDYYYEQAGLVDYSAACNAGGDSPVCRIGAAQKQKVLFDPRKSKKRDIMRLPVLSGTYLISRRLKDLLEEAGLSGYRLIPCLDEGADYSEEELDVNSDCAELERTAPYFQLTVTAKVLRPPDAGLVTRIFSRCERCQAVYGFYSDATPSFQGGALSVADFQFFDAYGSQNVGTFGIPNQVTVVSARVVRLLLENRASGLDRYLTDPPIRHGVVELR